MNKKMTGSRVANIVIVIGLLIVPLMYAGLLTWAYEAPIDRLHRLKAAVVNLDQPTTAHFDDGDRTLQLGADLETKLTTGEAPGFGWEKATLDQAKSGLADGNYRAILVIPSDMSANFAKFAQLGDTSVKPTMIELQTDDSINYLAGTMATSVAKALEETVAQQGSAEYIDHLLLALKPIKDGLAEGAAGAEKLANGNQQIASGVADAHHGSQDLASGASKAASGAKTLADGTHRLKTGSNQLVVGVKDLQNGATQLADGSAQLSAGAKDLVAGNQQFASGLKKYTAGAGQLAEGSRQFAAAFQDQAGKTGLISGAEKLNGGIEKLTEVAKKADQGVDQLHQGAGKLTAGFKQAASGSQKISSGAKQLSAQLSPGNGNETIKDGTAKMVDFTKKLAMACKLMPADPICVGIAAKLGPEGFAGLTKQVQQLDQGVAQAGEGAKQLADGADQLTAQFSPATSPDNQTLYSGAEQILAATAKTDEAKTLKDATSGLKAGLAQLGQGASQLSSGLSQAGAKAGQLSAGAKALADQSPLLLAGFDRLSNGAVKLSGGIDQGTAGAVKLANGSEKLAAGTTKLDQGIGQLDSGASQLRSGTGQLADGAGRLSDGLKQLKYGSDQAAEGAKKLADSLSSGADKLPNIGETQAKNISDVASAPVKVKQERQHPVYNNGIGFAPFFMGLALWIGGIAVFLIFPALNLRKSHEEPFFVCALRSLGTALAFGFAQATLVVFGLTWLLHLNAVHLGALWLIALLSSMTFVVINQACVATLGFRGRFISVLLLCLQITTAGATFPIETTSKFLQFLHPLLPLTYTINAFRSLIAGGSVSLVPVVAVLLSWMLVAALLTLWATHRRTGMRPMPFDPALAFPGHGGAPSAPDGQDVADSATQSGQGQVASTA